MKDNVPKKSKMVYTPKEHIPLGEAVKTESGEYALRIKKAKENAYETISVGMLMTQIVQAAEINN